MAEKNINGNIAPATNGSCIPTIHLVLQGKGGVGKTVCGRLAFGIPDQPRTTRPMHRWRPGQSIAGTI